MAKKPEHNIEIEIKRSTFDKLLIKVKSFGKEKIGILLKSLVAILIAIVAFGVFAVIHENKSISNIEKYYILLEEYNAIQDKTDKKNSENVRTGLIDLVDNFSIGIAPELAAYTLGDLFYRAKDYGNSSNYYEKFLDLSSSDVFVPIVLNKLAIVKEMLKEYDSAIKLLQKIEKDYHKSIIDDQAMYNLARIYSLKGDKINTKKYCDYVIKNHILSPFSKKSKVLLTLISVK